jgi:hypothetical protein
MAFAGQEWLHRRDDCGGEGDQVAGADVAERLLNENAAPAAQSTTFPDEKMKDGSSY